MSNATRRTGRPVATDPRHVAIMVRLTESEARELDAETTLTGADESSPPLAPTQALPLESPLTPMQLLQLEHVRTQVRELGLDGYLAWTRMRREDVVRMLAGEHPANFAPWWRRRAAT